MIYNLRTVENVFGKHATVNNFENDNYDLW